MSEDVAAQAAAVSAAVTGPGTPDQVKVAKPAAGAVRTLFWALAVVCVGAAFVLCILTYHHWPEATASERIRYVGLIGLVLAINIPLIVFALSAGRIGRVEASAGAASLKLDA